MPRERPFEAPANPHDPKTVVKINSRRPQQLDDSICCRPPKKAETPHHRSLRMAASLLTRDGITWESNCRAIQDLASGMNFPTLRYFSPLANPVQKYRDLLKFSFTVRCFQLRNCVTLRSPLQTGRTRFPVCFHRCVNSNQINTGTSPILARWFEIRVGTVLGFIRRLPPLSLLTSFSYPSTILTASIAVSFV